MDKGRSYKLQKEILSWWPAGFKHEVSKFKKRAGVLPYNYLFFEGAYICNSVKSTCSHYFKKSILLSILSILFYNTDPINTLTGYWNRIKCNSISWAGYKIKALFNVILKLTLSVENVRDK